VRGLQAVIIFGTNNYFCPPHLHTVTIYLAFITVNLYWLTHASAQKIIRRRRQRVVSEDRSVAPDWPLLMAERHKSAGEWLSWRSWSTQDDASSRHWEICWERG